MSASACNCCGEPPCPVPTLEAVSVEATCLTCGYPPPTYEGITAEDAAKCYKTKKYTRIIHNRTELDFFGTHRVETYDETLEMTYETVPDGEGGCEEKFVSGAFHSVTTSLWTQIDEPFDDVVDQELEITTSAGADGVWEGTEKFTNNVTDTNPEPDPNDSYEIPSDESGDFIRVEAQEDWSHDAGVYSEVTGTADELLTRRVTMSDLNTVCALDDFPEYPGWASELTGESPGLEERQGYESSTLLDIECGSASRSRKIKWRILHAPSGTCYLKVWVRKSFTPTVGTPSVTEVPYVWLGSGNPCLTNAALAADHEDNKIRGGETEESAPGSNGATTLEVLKYACVPGYEPDISDEDNPQPNGFPDLTWEASPP